VTVNKELTRLEKSSVRLSITISKDDVRSEYDELLSEYTKSVQLPGFRKGKVPKEVLIRKFGDSLKTEAMGKIVEKAAEEAFKDESLPRDSRPLPYCTPKMEDDPALDLDSDLKFSIVYDALPVVKVEKWEGLEVEVADVTVGEEDIAHELEAVRDRNSIVLDKDDGQAAEKDDVVTVDYCELDEAGQAIEGQQREGFTFTLGSERNVYQFDSEIMGMKKGETKEFSKTYGDDFHDPVLAGKTVKLKVTLTALKVKKLPDLDDDLAQDVDEKFTTLADLKANIRERMEKDLENRLKSMKLNALLEKMMESTPVEIPESMMKMELDSRWRSFARNFNTDAAGLFKMMGNAPGGAQSVLENWRPDAEKGIHSRLIIETLIEDLKLEASDDEVEQEIQRFSTESGQNIEDVKKYYEEERTMEYLKKKSRSVNFSIFSLKKTP
jgi:trigger factor